MEYFWPLIIMGSMGVTWLAFEVAQIIRQRLDAARSERLQLDLWIANWHDTRKWLAEFPDVADALDYLKAEADGTGDKLIVDVRTAMRARRAGPERRAQPGQWPTLHSGLAEFVPPRPGLTAQAAATREAEFRVRYQHLGAEVAGDD